MSIVLIIMYRVLIIMYLINLIDDSQNNDIDLSGAINNHRHSQFHSIE